MERLLIKRLGFVLLVPMVLVAAATAGWADDDDRDQELAKRLVEKGEIRALPAIIEQVTASVPGKVLEVEFESEHGTYKYELKILRTDGRVQEVEVDARSGGILKIEDDD
jgi:uncharacterized membrane protein YkoI